jgi:RNA polymerase sigma-54 factor
MVDEFCILDLACPSLPGEPSQNPEPASSRIATIEKDLTIGYCPAQYARGRYAINYKKLYQLRVEGRFSKGEFQRIKQMIKNIELINMRLTILYRIITRIIETQRDYFLSGREEDLRPLTQQMLAVQLGVHRSTIHRAVTRKFVGTPWGETKSLKYFLGNSKRFVKSLLERIRKDSSVPQGGADLSDERVRRILNEKYAVQVARRTICAYRHELIAVGEGG